MIKLMYKNKGDVMNIKEKCDLLLDDNKELLSFKEMVLEEYFDRNLVIPVGKDEKENVYLNFETVHGLFVSGTTGTGKSVFLDTIILSLILKNSPQEIKFLFLDPKKIELGEYNGLPHILGNKRSISNNKEGFNALIKILKMIEKRIHTLFDNNYSSIEEYNLHHQRKWEHIFIVVDESSDIFKIPETKGVMEKILDYGKVIGFHVIIATNAYLKEFYDTKFLKHFKYQMSFDLASKEQAKYIEIKGADLLKGQALIKCPNNKKYQVVTPYVSDKEITKVIEYITKFEK